MPKLAFTSPVKKFPNKNLLKTIKKESGFTFLLSKNAVASRSEGFTLIEVTISLGILLLIFLMALASYSTFTKQVDLDSTSQSIISTLRLAQSRTLASEADTVYGVHFENSKYTLFSGPTYIDGAVGNKDYYLTDSEIFQINLNGGGNEVIFDRIRGTTAESGAVLIRLRRDNNRIIKILIDSSGQVSVDNSISPTDTRVVDNRHLHFDLGWSIQNKSTLTLTFSNPTVIQNIAMAGFFNPGKTVFDWSGTVDVNGSKAAYGGETLRIHTHSLDAFNTVLSITRDQRYNKKALSISIDGLEIVSYASDGTATVGPSGGAMNQQ